MTVDLMQMLREGSGAASERLKLTILLCLLRIDNESYLPAVALVPRGPGVPTWAWGYVGQKK